MTCSFCTFTDAFVPSGRHAYECQRCHEITHTIADTDKNAAFKGGRILCVCVCGHVPYMYACMYVCMRTSVSSRTYIHVCMYASMYIHSPPLQHRGAIGPHRNDGTARSSAFQGPCRRGALSRHQRRRPQCANTQWYTYDNDKRQTNTRLALTIHGIWGDLGMGLIVWAGYAVSRRGK